ncbi:peptidase [Actinoplanes sp. NBRC 14428]|nr:peptidase [Actinoplanes sp. NBRC 14428]
MQRKTREGVPMLSRLLAGILIGAAAIPGPAAAAPPAVPPAPGAARPAAAGAETITLVTGDTVQLSRAAGGRYAATVTPAPGREAVTFHTFEVDGGLRVLPADAIPLVRAGRVDADLFDVERLIADGYGDARSATLPLIVQGGGAGMRAAASLSSIGATAVRPAKDTLAAFWQGQSNARTANAPKIWLDGRVRAALDRSTAQIGAPQAWQLGLDGRGVRVAVLDTGVDATHPDLAGKIAGTANFSSSPDVVDRFGHGTHVASTVAGTGAGSGGSRKGVAYGADVLVGKVLGDDGYGYESQIIAGMQWAVEQRARIVNMSLGSDATDGLDPMSLAVEELSESSGTLFVTSAGNEGRDSSIGTPGAAPHALAVGAVDRADRIAEFSSRGPRLGDEGLKPEITAPGVDIVAARATGTTMGQPVDALYTAASGTSMAAPHVAGAAAIIAQQHPGWNGERIKEALVSTAKTAPDLSVYAQGAGRADLARATTQKVTGTPVADFGLHAVGEKPAKHTRTVTYTNDGDTAVTLTLKKPAAVSLSANTVTVPAHGTAAVTVTLDVATLAPGRISGWLTATATGVQVTTAVGGTVDGPVRRVTVKAVDRSGAPTFVPAFTLFGDDGRSDVLGSLSEEGETFEVQEGTYMLDAEFEDGEPQNRQANYVTIPELKVDRDLTVLVDGRKGTPIRIETPRPAEQQTVLSFYSHRVTGTGRGISHGVMKFSYVAKVNVAPTRKVAKGDFEFSSRWQLAAPLAAGAVPGVRGPLDLHLMSRSPYYQGTRRFPLVKWGAKDVRGKAVLIQGSLEENEQTQIDAAAKAGAAVALMMQPVTTSAWTSWHPDGQRMPTIAVTVGNDTAQKLLKRVPATIDLTLTPSSPYLYDVVQVSKDRVPEKIVHTVTAANSMRIASRYADNGGFDWVREQRFGWRPWQTYAWNDRSRSVRTPSAREEWVSAGDSVWQHRVHHAYPWDSMGPLKYGFADEPVSYRAGHRSESWVAPVVRPADVGSRRTGDVLHLRVPEFVDSDGHYSMGEADSVAATLWRDGKQIAELPDGWQDVTTVAGTATYRLRLDASRGERTGSTAPVRNRSGRSSRAARVTCPCSEWTTTCARTVSGWTSRRSSSRCGPSCPRTTAPPGSGPW